LPEGMAQIKDLAMHALCKLFTGGTANGSINPLERIVRYV